MEWNTNIFEAAIDQKKKNKKLVFKKKIVYYLYKQ